MERDLDNRAGKGKTEEEYEQLLTKDMARRHGYLGE